MAEKLKKKIKRIQSDVEKRKEKNRKSKEKERELI